MGSLGQCFRSPDFVKSTRNVPRGCIWWPKSGDPVRGASAWTLWSLVSRWSDVGSYRRALSGNETKLRLTPVLLRAVDEPSAYLDPGELIGGDDPWLRGS